MSASVIIVEELNAGYDAPVVGPISFSLSQGEVLGIWGHNGCGKSTLLNAIAGQSRIFSGRVEIAPAQRLKYLTQQPQRLVQMPFSGREYLSYAEVVQAAPTHLAPVLGRRVDRLSGGQFQLLAILAALGSTADLVLLDEPTNNLDPGNEELLTDLLHTGHDDRGVLLVSNERTFLERVSTRILDMSAC